MRLRRRDPQDVTGGHSGARERRKKQGARVPKTPPRHLKDFRFFHLAPGDLDHPRVVREAWRCNRGSCRCNRGQRHGPYYFLRFSLWNAASGEWRLGREYIPKHEIRRVRRWLRRRRAGGAYLRGMLSAMQGTVRDAFGELIAKPGGHLLMIRAIERGLKTRGRVALGYLRLGARVLDDSGNPSPIVKIVFESNFDKGKLRQISTPLKH